MKRALSAFELIGIEARIDENALDPFTRPGGLLDRLLQDVRQLKEDNEGLRIQLEAADEGLKKGPNYKIWQSREKLRAALIEARSHLELFGEYVAKGMPFDGQVLAMTQKIEKALFGSSEPELEMLRPFLVSEGPNGWLTMAKSEEEAIERICKLIGLTPSAFDGAREVPDTAELFENFGEGAVFTLDDEYVEHE